jgi:hypothetical protein
LPIADVDVVPVIDTGEIQTGPERDVATVGADRGVEAGRVGVAAVVVDAGSLDVVAAGGEHHQDREPHHPRTPC